MAVLFLVLAGTAARSQDQTGPAFDAISAPAAAPVEPAEPVIPNSTGVRRALFICGLPGDAAHRKLFADSLELLYAGLTQHHGFAPENVQVLWGDEPAEADGPAVRSSAGVTSRETLTQTADALRASLAPDDALWVFVLGHAYLDGRYSWLNISGPDIQQLEFGQLFQGLPAGEQVFFITTACSGFYLKPLALPGRLVISATEPDLEVNETLFPHKLATALGNPPHYSEMESDKDGQLTLYDVYLWTARQVAQEYVTGELLATEHSLIDDNGDGRGTEVQIDYFPEELGGRLRAGQDPPARPKTDGLRACAIVLTWPDPSAPLPEPDPRAAEVRPPQPPDEDPAEAAPSADAA